MLSSHFGSESCACRLEIPKGDSVGKMYVCDLEFRKDRVLCWSTRYQREWLGILWLVVARRLSEVSIVCSPFKTTGQLQVGVYMCAAAFA